MLSRADILGALCRALAPEPTALAFFEGGSTAFGRADAWSDLDLQLIVQDGAVEPAFAICEGALRGIGTIDLQLRISEPAWHGHSQSFYRLADASEFLLIDLTIVKESSHERFLEPERHGTPEVLFDRTGLVRPAPLDRGELRARAQRQLEGMRTTYALFANMVDKGIHRGQPLDAIADYHGRIIRPLATLLRMRFDPDRFDYGMRYLHHDLPADVAARLTRLAYVGDFSDLAAKLAEARGWIAELLGSPGVGTGD